MYSVLFEDENFLIVAKDSGILVHKTKYESENNLIDAIGRERRENYFLVNRIDRCTSGLVILAKNREVLRLMQGLFSQRKIEKIYLAIVSRELPARRVIINLSLGRSRGKRLMFSNASPKNYKPATTEVREISGRFVSISLVTGRTHQIRCHLKSIGCPIVNDPLYGDKVWDKEFGQYLHSYYLSFTCPISSREISVRSPLPSQFIDMLKEMNIDHGEYL